ncbi:DNA segregation ATPase FtsK/SpoIIIE, S-DNA-T family [Pedococcus dokdonensis]|uniref:DNA segregation ATPase FtsK/SpoIIIE, S-DNA-T family n=2 Tax=Pedococcus dokdonensis TaxID=443156 RepID=A0A1H0SBP8_9MICO|nr:DNA segregation ATPase FtsK/SpoIIIE, S-DNA-T family [Pedococcus dokdonensis]
MIGRMLLRFVSGPDAGLVWPVVERTAVGRGQEAGLRLTDPSVSRRHALVELRDGGMLVVDTGSRTGTRVDSRQVTAPVLVRPGGQVAFGESTAVVLEVRAAPPGSAEAVLVATHHGVETARVPVRAEVLLGREATSDLHLDDPSVSRRHATVSATPDGLLLADLDSFNGTKVNGQRVGGTRALLPGDTITLGRSRTLVSVVSARRGRAPATELQVRSETGMAVQAVTLGTQDQTSVGDVAAALAAYLDLTAGARTSWCLYRREDGSLLRNTDAWGSVPLRRGDVLTVAAFDEALVPAASAGDPPFADAPDTTVNTPPRATAPVSLVEVAAPDLPEGTELSGRGVGWQVAAGLVAVLAAGVVAVRYPAAMLFAGVAAVAGLATIGFGILGDQSRRKHGVKTFHAELGRLDERLEGIGRAQAEALRTLSPERAELATWVATQGPRLWERRLGDEDFLRIRLGTGARARAAKVTGTGARRPASGRYADELAACRHLHSATPDVPIITPSAGVVGLAGPRTVITAMTASAVLEAAILHAPSALKVVVVGAGPDWGWVRWLPHVSRASARLLATGAVDAGDLGTALRVESGGSGAAQPKVLLVVGQGGSQHAAVIDAIRAVSSQGGLVLVMDDEARSLPPECQVVCRAAASLHVVAEGLWEDGPIGPFIASSVDPETAGRIAVGLGRLRDPRSQAAGGAGSRGVLELSGLSDSVRVSERWLAPGPGVQSVFGADDQGEPVSVDLRRDGPHGIIAGTTGAGKSELLLSFIASLVAQHPPDRLALFLIDFKGGATFAALERLPHVVGYVTDLDASERLSERAFTSLDAEISRRKRVLADHGVPDLAAYERLEAAPSMPTLLVVIDEFALLVTEQPRVKPRLDAIAAQGRSLGIHLLLATQSPGGVITPAIRANTNIWLCLRVVNDSESMEILGSRDAAQIPNDAPGRAYLRRGAERTLVGFQTARVTIGSAGSGPVDVRVSPFGEPPPPTWHPESRSGAPVRTELDRLVSDAAHAHSARGATAPPSLWIPPLTHDLGPDDPALAASAVDRPHDPDRLTVRLGLLDEPEAARQRPYDVDVALTNVLVSGVFRSGRTTAVRRIVAELVRARSPRLLHLYVIDGRGGLREVADLPHTGGHTGVHDLELLAGLVDRVGRVVEQRREHGFDPATDARVVLVVDDYPTFREASQPILQDRLNDQLLSLVAQGRSLGVHVVMTCGQVNDLRLTLASHFQTKILLRQPEAVDYAVVDVRLGPGEMPEDLPGRALVRGGHEVQIVNQLAVPPTAEGDSDGRPSRLVRLPTDHSEDAAAGLESWPPGQVPIGVGGDDAAPVWLGPRHGPHLVVLGESLTGRTTALRTVAGRLLAEDPTRVLAVVTRRRGSAAGWDSMPRRIALAEGPEDLNDLLDAVEASPAPVVLVVDDAEALGASASAGDRLERLLRDARGSGLRSVVGARTADWARLFDGWARYLASLRVALLLAPTPEAAMAAETRLPATVVPMVQGRGFLVAGGRAELVQVTRLVERPHEEARPVTELAVPVSRDHEVTSEPAS